MGAALPWSEQLKNTYWCCLSSWGKPPSIDVLVVTAPVDSHSYRACRSSRLVAHGLAELRSGGLISNTGGIIGPMLAACPNTYLHCKETHAGAVSHRQCTQDCGVPDVGLLER